MTSKIEDRNSKIENPASFAAACAWNRFRRWDPEVLARYREDARQACSLIGLEVEQAALVDVEAIHRLVGLRVREFAYDYGFVRFQVNGSIQRADVLTTSVDDVAAEFDSEKLADGVLRSGAASAWQARSDVPPARQLCGHRIRHTVSRNFSCFRQQRRLSINEVCRRASCVKLTVRGLEDEAFDPWLSTLFRLGHALEVAVESLFDGIERRPSRVAWPEYWDSFFKRLWWLAALTTPTPGMLIERATSDRNFRRTMQETSLGIRVGTVANLARELSVWPQYLVKEAR